jgi:hypothetical protein
MSEQKPPPDKWSLIPFRRKLSNNNLLESLKAWQEPDYPVSLFLALPRI